MRLVLVCVCVLPCTFLRFDSVFVMYCRELRACCLLHFWLPSHRSRQWFWVWGGGLLRRGDIHSA